MTETINIIYLYFREKRCKEQKTTVSLWYISGHKGFKNYYINNIYQEYKFDINYNILHSQFNRNLK